MDTDISKKSILIVDDTPENIDVLGHLLSEYNRYVATSGKKALEIAMSEKSPDLILLDIMMPEMDGYEVLAALKADSRTKQIPVIFVTAKGAVADEKLGLEAGAVDYIAKPFQPSIVKARVQTQLTLVAIREQLQNQNKILEERVLERTKQLQEAFDRIEKASLETVVRLARAADHKDDDTGAHVLRMSYYAAAVAKQMGYSEDEANVLLHAAPLHDIGKIGIPDNILLKPGKLDDDEWNVMRTHCKIGADILSGSQNETIKLAEIIAISHHERWDGSGYPRKLKGNDIPLAGRIVAIADVFDALTTKRPYKEPFSIEKSFAILKESSGNHFDPAVVEAFFAIEDSILQIKEKYQSGDIKKIMLEKAGLS